MPVRVFHPRRTKPSRFASAPRIKLGLRAPVRVEDEFEGLERLDRPELDEDYEPPSSTRRVA